VTAYVFRLIPPRPTFTADMSGEEQEAMAQHAVYWRELTARGHVVGFGPVDDPGGTYGIALVTAQTRDEAQAFADEDPVIRRGIGFRTEIAPMLALVTPDQLHASQRASDKAT
jgi:uncharacterized protein YciI